MNQKELTWLYIFDKIKRVNFMEQFLLEKIKKLGIKEFENFNSLNLMDGNYLNIECILSNGDKTKILTVFDSIARLSVTLGSTYRNRLL